MLLFHSLWLGFTILSVGCAVGSSSTPPPLHNIQSTHIDGGKEKVMFFSDSGIAEANGTNLELQPSSVTKHLRLVTNTSGFPDQPPPSVNNSMSTVSPKTALSPVEVVPKSSTTAPSSTTTASTTTSTSTTTTTTTTKIPKKPTITYDVLDQPELLAKIHDVIPPMAKAAAPQVHRDPADSYEAVAPQVEPISLQSPETISLSKHKDGRAFMVPMVAIIFIIPFLVILANFVTRQLRDYWSKRKYRRMDYLIEEMYHWVIVKTAE